MARRPASTAKSLPAIPPHELPTHPKTHTNPEGPRVTRAGLARILGLSYQHVIRMEAEGKIAPQIIDGDRALYDYSYAMKVLEERAKARNERLVSAQTRQATAQATATAKAVRVGHTGTGRELGGMPVASELALTSGELSARIFSAFKRGVELADVVIEEKISPRAAKVLHDEWVAMRGMLVLTREDLVAMTALGLEGDYPVANGEMLLANLRAVAEARQPCSRCKGKRKRPREVCRTCVGELLEEAAVALGAEAEG